MGFGALKVGDQVFEVVELRPEDGRLRLRAFRQGPANLDVPRAEWTAPDGSLMCVIEPFLVGTQDMADARLADDVTVFQDIAITEVITHDQPSGTPLTYHPF